MLVQHEGQRQCKERRKRERQAKDKGKDNAKATKYFPGYRIHFKAWRPMKKDCCWSESAKSGKDTASLETPVTLAVSTTTESPITGMLMQSDDSKAVPADFSQWLYSVTNCETVSKAWKKAWEENPEDLEWNSGQPLDNSSPRQATRRFACAHEAVSIWRVTFRLRPRILACIYLSYRSAKCATKCNIMTFRSTGGTILNEFTGNRIEFERVGGVYRLRFNT